MNTAVEAVRGAASVVTVVMLSSVALATPSGAAAMQAC
jgi:hypothetical protein